MILSALILGMMTPAIEGAPTTNPTICIVNNLAPDLGGQVDLTVADPAQGYGFEDTLDPMRFTLQSLRLGDENGVCLYFEGQFQYQFYLNSDGRDLSGSLQVDVQNLAQPPGLVNIRLEDYTLLALEQGPLRGWYANGGPIQNQEVSADRVRFCPDSDAPDPVTNIASCCSNIPMPVAR